MGRDDDSHLAEATLTSELLLDGGFLQVRRDIVSLPSGAQASREYIRHPGAVAVMPLLDDGRVLMERQWRHPLGRVMLECPAGKIDPGETTLQCAQRELLEETGHSATEWAYACTLHNAAAYSDEHIEIWFARGLSAGAQHLDVEEFVELVTRSEAELDAAAQHGEITDAKTLIALMWLQRWRAGLWPLVWQQVTGVPR